MNNLTKSILIEAAECFRNARSGLVAGAEKLCAIHEEGLWKGEYSSFGEYVEQECQISQGMASKLMAAWRHYVIEGGVSQRKLESVDVEKLYLAIKLPGTPDQQLIKAETLSRSELKQERAVDENGVDCPHTIHICAKCHARV